MHFSGWLCKSKISGKIFYRSIAKTFGMGKGKNNPMYLIYLFMYYIFLMLLLSRGTLEGKQIMNWVCKWWKLFTSAKVNFGKHSLLGNVDENMHYLPMLLVVTVDLITWLCIK